MEKYYRLLCFTIRKKTRNHFPLYVSPSGAIIMKVTGWLADDQNPLSLDSVFTKTGEYGIDKMKAINKRDRTHW